MKMYKYTRKTRNTIELMSGDLTCYFYTMGYFSEKIKNLTRNNIIYKIDHVRTDLINNSLLDFKLKEE